MPILNLIAGGLVGNRDASNRNVDIHNEEIKENRAAQQKMWLQKAQQEYEEYKHQRDVAREDQKFERDRSAKKEDTQAEREFLLERDKFKHNQNVSLENMRESGRNSRAAQRNAILEKKAANSGKSGGQGNSKSVNHLQKLINDDERELRSVQEKMFDPMISSNQDHIAHLQQVQDNLQRSIAARKTMLDQQLSGSQQAPALNLQGLLNKQ